jgi:hypothetical protein
MRSDMYVREARRARRARVLAAVLFLPPLLAGCDQALPGPSQPEIESPLRNTCQSGDLLKDFPQCRKGRLS